MEDIKKKLKKAGTAAEAAALAAQVGKIREGMARANRDVGFSAREGGEIIGRSAPQMSATSGIVMRTAAADAAGDNRRLEGNLIRQAEVGAQTRQAAREQREAELQRADQERKARTLAKYGDFSGYGEAGYNGSQIAKMQQAYDKTQRQNYKLNPYVKQLLSAYFPDTGYDIKGKLKQALDAGLISGKDYNAALLMSDGVIGGAKAPKPKKTKAAESYADETPEGNAVRTRAEEAFGRVTAQTKDGKYIVRFKKDWEDLKAYYGEKELNEKYVYEPQKPMKELYDPRMENKGRDALRVQQNREARETEALQTDHKRTGVMPPRHRRRGEPVQAQKKEPMQDRARMTQGSYQPGDVRAENGRLGNAIQGIGLNLPASAEYLGETAKQTLKDNRTNRENGATALREAAEIKMRKAAQLRQMYGEKDPRYLAALEEAKKAYAAADEIAVRTPVAMDSRASQLMQKSAGYQQKALEGLDGAGRFLGETALSIGNNLAVLPTAAINPALPLALMGAQAAAGKAYELGQRGIPAREALARGLASGAIEAATEKMGLDNLMDLVKFGGKSAVVDLLKQAGIEGAEEGASYILNYAADKLAKDPEAKFDGRELLTNMGAGALSGGLMGAGGTVINKLGNLPMNTETAEGPQLPVNETTVKNDPAEWREPLNLPGTVTEKAPTKLKTEVEEMGRAIGRTIEFMEAEPDVNGYYDPKTQKIYVNTKSENPVAQIVGHELTHSVELADAYLDIDALVKKRILEEGGSLDKLRREKREAYAAHGIELDAEGVDKEIVAEYAEKHLFSDEESITRLAQENRSLAHRIKAWLDRLIAKLGSKSAKERVFLEKARNAYTEALEQTHQIAERSATNEAIRAEWDQLNADYNAGLLSEEQYDRAQDELLEKENRNRQYSFAGHYARTADLDALKRAKEMQAQGENNEAIRQATGWFRGMDGKWRFEIDDSRMKYRGPEGKTLGEILDHPALFEAYPNLRKAKVRFENLSGGESGSYNSETNIITLDEKLKNAPESTLIHEIQHAIQNTEGFARGASPGLWSLMTQSTDDYIDEAVLRSRQKKLFQEIDKLEKEIGLEEYLDSLDERYFDGEITEEQVDQMEEEYIREKSPELVELKDELYNDVFEKLKAIGKRKPDADALYKNTAGEIEARDTEARRKLTDEGRRETMPNLGDENTVFVEDTNLKGPQYSISDKEYGGGKAGDAMHKASAEIETDLISAFDIPASKKADAARIAENLTRSMYENGKLTEEEMAEAVDALYNMGEVEEETGLEGIEKPVRDYLKNTRITISEQDKANIPDFAEWRKRAFGKLRIVNEGGVPVDQAYAELSEVYPGLFPADKTHPADQLEWIAEVAEDLKPRMVSLAEANRNDGGEYRRALEEALREVIDANAAKVSYAKRFNAEKAQKAEQKAAEAETTLADLPKLYDEQKRLRKLTERTKARNPLTDADRKRVGQLLRGDIEPDMIRENRESIMEVYEAQKQYEDVANRIKTWNKTHREELYKWIDSMLLGNVSTFRDKRSGIEYARETQERNIRDIVPDKELAEKIIREIFTPVHKGAADSTTMQNAYRERVKKMNLSRNIEAGNAVSEAHAVQLLGEATDNMEMLRNSRDPYKTRDGKTFDEWEATIDNLWQTSPNLDKAKIENAVEQFRDIYDELFDMMNAVRIRNGYEPINYRHGYFPHFQPGETGLLNAFAKAMGQNADVTSLPTSISGLTHTFKPGIRWIPNAQERIGFSTTYDAVEGFDRYIVGVADVVHQTDNIQRLRAFANRIRYLSTDEGIRQQVRDVENDPLLSDIDKRNRIEKIYENGKFAMANYVKNLDEYTNLLAGKKSFHDRVTEDDINRQIYNLATAMESRVAANMVAINPGSWLTNFIPLTQGGAQLKNTSMLKGMRDALENIKSDDGFVDRSTFLTNRRGTDPLVRTWSQKASKAMSMPMEYIDMFTAETLVRARYAENIQKGMSEQASMDEADAWAADIMADRSKGSMPTLFDRKSPAWKALTQFQLEQNNQLSNLFKDLPRESRNKAGKALAVMLFKYFVGAFIYNDIYEKLIGRRPALDPIGMFSQAAGDFTGYKLPNTVDAAKAAFSGKLPDFKTEKLDKPTAVWETTKSVGGQLPFVGGLIFEGGRLPISSALPDPWKLTNAALNDEWSGKKRLTTAGKELLKPAAYMLPTFGGGQIKKVAETVDAFARGGKYGMTKEGAPELQYPVYTDQGIKTAGNAVRAAVFGPTSLPTAKGWIDSGFKGLSERDTAAYRGAVAGGAKQQEAFDLVNAIRGAEKTEGKRQILNSSDLPEKAKAAIYREMLASDKEKAYLDGGDPQAYDLISKLRGAESQEDKLRIVSTAGVKDKVKAAELVLGDKMTTDEGNPTKLAKIKQARKAGAKPDAAIRMAAANTLDDYLDLHAAGVSSGTAEKLAGALDKLKPLEGKKSVSAQQKWQVAIDTAPEAEQDKALRAVMTKDAEKRYSIASGHGVSPSAYVAFQTALPEFDANGSGSLDRHEIQKALDTVARYDGVQLTRDQKAALWQLATGSTSTKNNPYSKKVAAQVIAERKSGKTEEKKPKLMLP